MVVVEAINEIGGVTEGDAKVDVEASIGNDIEDGIEVGSEESAGVGVGIISRNQ